MRFQVGQTVIFIFSDATGTRHEAIGTVCKIDPVLQLYYVQFEGEPELLPLRDEDLEAGPG